MVVMGALAWRSVAYRLRWFKERSGTCGERRFAAALARHVERWYREAGVEAAYFDDKDLAKALAGKKVAVLVYLAQPNAAQMAALTAHVNRGGKLIVCYSSSPALAALMGMQTVGYQKGSTDGRWSLMRFAETRPHGVPESILQTSQNLFLVQPLAAARRCWRGGMIVRAAGPPSRLAGLAQRLLDDPRAAGGRRRGGQGAAAAGACRGARRHALAACRRQRAASGAPDRRRPDLLAARAGQAADPARRARAVAAAQALLRADADARQRLAAVKGIRLGSPRTISKRGCTRCTGSCKPRAAARSARSGTTLAWGFIPATGRVPAAS
jgi:hypothetical protein